MNGPLEKITAFHAGPFVGLFVGTMESGSNCAQFIRLDLHEAAVAAARAEGMREAAKPQLSAKQQYCLDSLVQHGPSSSWHICARALVDGTNKTRCRYEWADAPIRELRAKGLIEKTGAQCFMDRPIYRAAEASK